MNRLYVHWDVLSKCNYSCSYCYAHRFYDTFGKWGIRGDFNIQKHIIKCLSLSELPVFLGLQGGEPTIDKNFSKIIELINEQILSRGGDNRLYITSNISNSKLLELVPNKETFILASFHPEFADAEHFLDVISQLKFKTRVNLMLINDVKYYDVLHSTYEKLKELQTRNTKNSTRVDSVRTDSEFWDFKLQIHPHFVYTDHSRGHLDNYSEDFYREFEYMKDDSKEFIVECNATQVETAVLSDYEVFEKDLHHFYGYKCYNNNHEIDFEGNVKILCKETKVNLRDNPLYFKKIRVIEPIICPHLNCNCDGLLKVLKIRT